MRLLILIFVAILLFAAVYVSPFKISGGAYQGPLTHKRQKDPEFEQFIESHKDIDMKNINRYIRESDAHIPEIQRDIREYYSKK